MQPLVLLPFALASLLLAAVIEILAQRSQQNGGLALSASVDDISPATTFAYLFLPTIIAVIFSLVWSWIDLDVKRMQPWLELSRSDGVTADSSLFLDYPYDFVAFVPFKAAKRRHWAVFFAGTTMMIIFWLITPLQSALLGVAPVVVQHPALLSTSSSIMPVDGQAAALDQSVLTAAYAITWMEQPYPPFTTANYALLPFTAQDASTSAPLTTNMTGVTTQYWTELECWEAKIAPASTQSQDSFTFDNTRGCVTESIQPYNSLRGTYPYRMLYIGYYNSPWASYFLSNPNCSSAHSNQFLAIWSKFIAAERTNVSATFCETSYYKQLVRATVSAGRLEPQDASITPLGPKERLLQTEFNSSAFEYLLGSGVSAVDMERDFPSRQMLEQYPRVIDQGLAWPLTPLVGFAIGQRNITAAEYANETEMAVSYTGVHKSLFALAVSQMLQNSTTASPTEGTLHIAMFGVVVSRIFSAVVEGLLLLVALFTLALCALNWKAESVLARDPSSLGSIIDIVQHSPELLSLFAGKGNLSVDALRQALATRRFRLLCGCQTRRGEPVIKVLAGSEDGRPDSSSSSIGGPAVDSNGHYDPVRPRALRLEVGAMFIFVMIGAVAYLAYLKAEEQMGGGLPRPSQSFEVLLILENYIPTAFATLIEPFWVLLNRLLCIIQPFKDLWDGGQPASKSIDARYTSIPPQLAIVRAAKSGHILLTLMCLVALLANLLAVGLGGLFNELPVVANYPIQVHPEQRASINNDSLAFFANLTGFFIVSFSYYDHFYVTMANLTQGAPTPPWVTEEYFFQPFMATAGQSQVGSHNVKAQTRGFTVDPFCQPVVGSGIPPRLSIPRNDVPRSTNPNDTCPDFFTADVMKLNDSNFNIPLGRAAAEVSQPVSSDNFFSLCDKTLVVGWGRTPDAGDPNGTVNSAFMYCQPVLKSALFEVTVDPAGRVVNATRTSELETGLGVSYPLAQKHIDSFVVYSNRLLANTVQYWHNDTITRSWLDHLLKVKLRSTALVDPATPLPPIEDIIPPVEDIYRRQFVALMGLNQYIFDKADNASVIEGWMEVVEPRIFMELSAFIISMLVLGLNIIVAIVFYSQITRFFLPRIPTTIGSLLAYVAPSRIVQDYAQGSPEMKRTMTVRFGRFIGSDGRAHVGIEREPLVVPVQLLALKRGNTLGKPSIFDQLLRRKISRRRESIWL